MCKTKIHQKIQRKAIIIMYVAKLVMYEKHYYINTFTYDG